MKDFEQGHKWLVSLKIKIITQNKQINKMLNKQEIAKKCKWPMQKRFQRWIADFSKCTQDWTMPSKNKLNQSRVQMSFGYRLLAFSRKVIITTVFIRLTAHLRKSAHLE